mgnify:FL=1
MSIQNIIILDDGWEILDEQCGNIPRYIALSLLCDDYLGERK